MNPDTLSDEIHDAFIVLFGDDHELAVVRRLATACVGYLTALEEQRLSSCDREALAKAMPRCYRAEMELREATVDLLAAISRVADLYGEGLTLDGFLEECLENRGVEDEGFAA